MNPKLFLVLITLPALGQENPALKLADELIRSTPAQRQYLLDKGAMTADLAKELHERAVKLSKERKTAASLEMEQLTLRVAQGAHDRSWEQKAYAQIALSQSSTGQLKESSESYQNALNIAEELKDRPGMLENLIGLSLTYKNLGMLNEGLRCGDRALELAVELKNRSEEARARNTLANIHREVGRFSEALAQYEKALEIAEQDHLEAGVSYLTNNLGGIYVIQENFELALRYLQRSLEIKERRKDPSISSTLSVLADTYLGLGRNREAMEVAERSLRLATERGEPTKRVDPLRSIGLILSSTGNFKGAIARFMEAAQIAGDAKQSLIHASLIEYVSVAQLDGGMVKEALKTALDAKSEAIRLGDDLTASGAATIAAKASLQLGDRRRAREYAVEGIAAHERLRENAAGGADDRASYYEAMLEPYVVLARVEADTGQIRAAFETSERARSRALAEVLKSAHTSVTRSMTAGEQVRETQLQAAIRRGGGVKARADYKAFLNGLYAKHPDLQMGRVQDQPLSGQAALAILPDTKTVMLEYLVTPDETLLFAASKDRGIRLYRLKIKDSDVGKQVRAYRDMIAGKDMDFRDSAQKLYHVLLAPAEAELAGRTSIVLVPGGPLWDMPFQALSRPDGRFLSESFRISYAPSVTVLAAMAKRPQSTATRLLAMAQGLAEAEAEASALGALYGSDARVFTGAAAKESVFKSQAAGFGILHLASHGVLENASPMYSYVGLGKDASEDGRLEAAELMNMELKARLAILSACDTARGRIGAGEGVMGLTWALAVAGVPTTIASGWKVDSKVTSELMVELHRGLRAHLSPAAALRQASLKVMAQPAYRHPFYWGAFAVYGLGW